MAFIDEAKFFVKGGDGGRGCVSFRREKYVPKGGPDGGDGGDGGSLLIEATGRLLSLLDFRYASHFKAKSGTHGMGKKKHGKKGADKVIFVPLGSVLKDADTDRLLADLVHEGDSFVAAAGGRGGAGNARFATAQNRTPRRAGKGTPGEERWLKIELKLIADIGLIGLPNAGKSTLLSCLSAANPKIAPYPFTTLEPKLGIVHFEYRDPCIVADIPGIIEGAHEGLGLGHKFLRHVERTKILLHVLDAGSFDADPLRDMRTLENELALYKNELALRKRLLVLNKTDLIDKEQDLVDYQQQLEELGYEVLSISALSQEGLDNLKERIGNLLDEEIV